MLDVCTFAKSAAKTDFRGWKVRVSVAEGKSKLQVRGAAAQRGQLEAPLSARGEKFEALALLGRLAWELGRLSVQSTPQYQPSCCDTRYSSSDSKGRGSNQVEMRSL